MYWPASITIILSALFLIQVSTETVKFKNCDKKSSQSCLVSDVVIDPCPEAATGEPCKFMKGKSASIYFKFQPNWEQGEGELKTRAYWAAVLDLPLAGMDTDACKYTACPIKKGAENEYNFTLPLSASYPSQKFDVKFKIWEDKAKNEKKECCLIFAMRLV